MPTPARHARGGQPWTSLAHATSVLRSLKPPSPALLALKTTVLRAPPADPSGRDQPPSITASAHSQPRLNISSWSMKPGPAAMGAPTSCAQQVTPVGAWPPHACRKKAGDRVHTARRDAVPRARLRRAGALPPVDGPTGDDDAIRDRTRAEASHALNAAPFRLNAFWRRPANRSTGRATWSPAHLRWRCAGVGPTPAQPSVCQAEVRAVTEPTARRQRLAQARQAPVTTWRLPPGGRGPSGLRRPVHGRGHARSGTRRPPPR
jgi:hypothetical protein